MPAQPSVKLRPNVPPALVGTAAGGALLALAVKRRGVGGALAGIVGAGLLASNLPALTDELIATGARRDEVALRETLVFARNAHEMFTFCANFEHFPEIVSFLERVVDYDNGRSRWWARTPSGRLVEWEAMVTKYLPDQVIAWESVPNSPVRSSGLVRFRPLGSDRTRLDLTLRFTPGRPSAIEALASLIRPARSTRLRTDLARAGGQPLRLAADQDSY